MTQHDTGRIKVVTGTGVTLALAAASVASASSASAHEQHHTVRKGETVSHLAARTGVSVAAIARANDLADPSRIYAGQRLVIPGPPTASTKASARTSSATSTSTPRTAVHTVVSGDTVSHLASRYGVSIADIVKANGLDSRAFIRVGQKLTIPGATSDTVDELPESERVPDTFAGRTYPKHVVASANKNKALLLKMGVPSKAEMQAKVVARARAMGVSTALAQAIAYQESGFNHAAVSPANAIGTMQVIPTSGDWASDLVGTPINLLDPDDNVTAGVAILRQLIRMSPDLDSAIAGYYQGAASVRKYGMFSDTRRYVANVRTLMERFA